MNPEFKKQEVDRSEAGEADESIQVRFQEACFKRLDELVADGTFPLWYAKDRQESARLISKGLKNPEKQGIQFAETGLEAILEFREQVDIVAQQIEGIIDGLRGRIKTVRQEILKQGLDGYDGKKVKAIELFQEKLERESADFHGIVEQIKDLQVEMAMLSPETLLPNIQDSIEELKENGVEVELE